MAGSSSVRGDQTIYHTDNICFDGTDRGSPMSVDGQLWIGATASNRADNGGHVRLGSLTAGTGITVTNGPGTITIASTATSSDLHVARYIVAADGTSGTGANYTTIASAITAAQTSGVNSTIFIQPGIYTENLTLTAGINLCAFDCDAQTPNVTIIGNITMTVAGTCSLSGIRFQTNSAAFLTLSGSAASVLNLNDCYLNCTNSTGIVFSSSSASARLNITNCYGDLGTTGIGLFTHSSAGILKIEKCNISNSGLSTTTSTVSEGFLFVNYSNLYFPITTSSASTFQARDSYIDTTAINTTGLTLNGSGQQAFFHGFVGTGSASSISIGSTLGNIKGTLVGSTNTNAITGAGTITFSSIFFGSTSSTINTTTQVPQVTSNDAIKIVTPAAYPYTTTAQDAFIKVDTSSARTIIPLASPATGQRHIIKDTVGSAGTNNITVTPSGKNIDGAASFVINVNYASITIVYNGVDWSII